MTSGKKIIAGLIVLTVAATISCGKNGSDNSGNTNDDTFKAGMLTNYADNIIIPAYTDFNAKVNSLESVINAFLAAPGTATLDAVKPVFKSAYVSYENISLPFFGPANALLMNTYVNTFPAVPAKIEAGIQTGTYNLDLPVASDSIQGFPALDYLLFSAGAVNKFTLPEGSNRKKYVQDLVARIKMFGDNTLVQWKSTYRGAFVASLKTDVGSSIGLLVNRFASEMDAMKGPRIGWPFGKQSNGIVFADKCEGYYGGFSAALAVANLTSLKNYYTGGAGAGIDDYLVLLKRDQLNNDVLAQFEVAINALKAIPEPMSQAFIQNAPVIEEAYRQVQKLLTLLKTDVASATAVQINYMDNDGD